MLAENNSSFPQDGNKFTTISETPSSKLKITQLAPEETSRFQTTHHLLDTGSSVNVWLRRLCMD
jgi:hypothetical protein